ncbi:response regulator transcription factor [Nocardioides sp. GXQ0305]|uniref:response regulator transcription factor n=1 Tax=Nocardioides sp. GXQ0305 TaxID=3423912 RepID=UPI003D7CB3E8
MDRPVLARRATEIAHGIAEGAAVVPDLLALLDRQVGADTVTFSELDITGRGPALVETHGADPLDADEEVRWRRLLPTHPYARWLTTAPAGTTRLTDVVSLTRLERMEVWEVCLEPRGHRYQSALTFPCRRRDLRLLSLWREDRDFADRELEAFEHVRRLVDAGFAMREAGQALREWSGPGGGTLLTPRQREVAALVSQGHTNEQVARRLGISARTVRKHVADLFDVADVRSRTALAAWWRQGGRSAI